MGLKYELTTECKEVGNRKLYRIRALKEIPRWGVKVGDLGGWIEHEDNLSHVGDAWVSGEAKVYGEAKVFGDACVYGEACVCGKAKVSGYAEVSGEAKVYGDAEVFDNAKVYGSADVLGYSFVFGNARVYGKAKVSGNACVYGEAKVYGSAEVSANALVHGVAEVSCNADFMVFKNSWSSGRYFTYTRSNKKWTVGCFHGTGEELIKKAHADSEISGRCYETIVKSVEQIERDMAELGKG